MDNQSEATSFDFQSPNSFTFVDMTKDVAFKIKYEGHKCLKVNKHFRNNEHFQNNFFVFKHEDSNDSFQSQEPELFSDTESSDRILLEHTEDGLYHKKRSCSFQHQEMIEPKISKPSCSLTFISSSPQNNFTANHNPHFSKQNFKKRKQKPIQESKGTDTSKRKKRRNSHSESDSTPQSTKDSIRKRKRAGSVDSAHFIAQEPYSVVNQEVNVSFDDCIDLCEFQQEDQTLIYSLLAQIQDQSETSSINHQIDLNFDEIDELLDDFSMVSESRKQLNEAQVHTHDNISQKSNDTFLNDFSNQDRGSSIFLPNTEEKLRSEGDPICLLEDNSFQLFDLQHQTDLIEEHNVSDLDALFENIDNGLENL